MCISNNILIITPYVLDTDVYIISLKQFSKYLSNYSQQNISESYIVQVTVV